MINTIISMIAVEFDQLIVNATISRGVISVPLCTP